MIFNAPLYFLLLLGLPFLIYYAFNRDKKAGLTYSSIDNLKKIPRTWTLRFRYILNILRLGCVVLIILALTRPQKGSEETRIISQGIDIVLIVDVSTSMLAEDFQIKGKRQNRLYVVKEVIKEFVKDRPDDRIGITVFGARPYTLSPLTLDHGWLLEHLDKVKIGMVEDGTAIGSGLSSGLNRLRDSVAKSKVVILLTDGRNNAGQVAPETAAAAAKALGVKVYTIGAGTKGTAPYPVKDFFGNIILRPVKIEIDDQTLAKIADTTGGKYFRATDTKSLRQVYKEIDAMEKTEIQTPRYMEYKELYPGIILLALVCLLIEIILSNTRFRRLP